MYPLSSPTVLCCSLNPRFVRPVMNLIVTNDTGISTTYTSASTGLTTSIMMRISTISRTWTTSVSRSVSRSVSAVVRSLVRREEMSPDEWESRKLMGTLLSLLWRFRLIFLAAFLETTTMFLLENIVAPLPNTYSAAITRSSPTNADTSRPVYPDATYSESMSMASPAMDGAIARAKLPATSAITEA